MTYHLPNIICMGKRSGLECNKEWLEELWMLGHLQIIKAVMNALESKTWASMRDVQEDRLESSMLYPWKERKQF